MGVKTSGGSKEMNYTFKLSIDDALKNANKMMQELRKLEVGVSKGFDVKPMTAFQQGVLKSKQELIEKNKIWKDLQITEQSAKTLSAQHKAVIDELKIAEQELNQKLKENKLTSEEYALAQKKLVDAQKLAIAAQKEADRQAGEANKRLKEQLALARQEEAQRERNRKKLEQESSAYFQLNKALNNVRKEAKDVLAGMYSLEQQGKKNTAEYKALELRSKDLVSQTQILDKGLKQIDATLGLHQRNVGNYSEALEVLNPRLAAINNALSVFGSSIQQLAGAGGMQDLGTQILSVGRSVLTFLISPVGLAITALTTLYSLFVGNKDTVIEFDDKLLDVGKTTGLASRGLVDLGNSVIELSKRLETVSSAKLLEYATVAGSLGVTGTEDILAFSEALAKLEIASNIQGEEGAAEIARLLTLTDGGVQNVKAFGDEIVNLGNAFAATEAEILSNAEQISQNTGLYKIGRQEVLAYATATKSVGLEAEMVGSAFGRTLSVFEKVLRTGEGLSELAKVTGLSVDDLKSKFKNDSSGVFNDFIKGLYEVNKNGGSVNEVLEKLTITGIRDQRVIATLASSGYDTLNKALVTVKGSTGALATEFDTASGKLTNISAKAGIAWDNLVLSIENGQGIIGKSSAAVVGFFTDMVASITPSTRSMTINEEAVNSLTARYDGLKKEGQLLGGSFNLTKDKQEELRKVTAQLGELMPSIITQFDKYGNALDINRAKIDQMTKAQRELIAVQNKGDIKNANQVFDQFSKGKDRLQGKILKGTGFFTSDADIADMRDRVVLMSGQMYSEVKRIKALGGELTKQQQEILDHYEKETLAVENSAKGNENLTNKKIANSARTKAVVEAEIAALQEQQAKLDIHSKEYSKNVSAIKKLQKELDDANGKQARASSSDAAFNAQRNLQEKITELVEKGKRKSLTDDEEEVANIKAKYDKLRAEAIKFNNDKKNIEKGLKVNTSGLDIAQTNETDAAIDKQKARDLKASLSEQKALYDDFEAYKLKIGTEAAKKLVGEKIDTEKTYLEYLKGLEEQLTNDPKAKGGDEALKEQQLKVLRESIAAQEALVKKNYQDLLVGLIDYEQTRSAMVEKYNKNREDLVKKGETKAVAVLDKIHKETIGSLDDQNIQKLDAYKNLFKDVDKLSDKALKKIIADGQSMLKKLVENGTISEEMAKEINNRLDATSKTLASRLPELLLSLGSELSRLGGVIGDIDSGFGQWLNTLGGVLGGIGDIQNRIIEINKLPKDDIVGQISQGVGAVVSGLSVVSSIGKLINGLFDKTKEKQEQEAYAADLRNRQAEYLNNILERQIALINEAYGVEKIKKYSDAIKTANDNEEKYLSELSNKILLSGDKVVDGIIEKLNRGEQLFGTDKLGYDALLKSSYFKKVGDLSKSTTEDLKRLLESTSLDEATKNLINSLIKAKEAIIDLNNAAISELTGTSFEAFADGIVEALGRGEDAAGNFGDAIRKAMLNSLKTEEFKAELQAWYDMFAEAAKGGLTEAELATLGPAYDAIIAKQKQRQAELEKATGIKLHVDDSELKELRSSILRLALDSQDLLKDLGNDFTNSLKEDFLKTMESGEYADKVKAYHERFAELRNKGFTAADVASLKAEFDGLAALAQEKIKEYEQRTGEKISVAPVTVPVEIDANTKDFGDKLYELLTKSADEAGKGIKEILTSYINDALRAEIVTDALKPLAEKIKNLYSGGRIPTKDEIAEATAEMNAFVEQAKAKLKTLEEVTGLTFGETVKEQVGAISETIDSELKSIQDDILGIFANTDGALANFEAKWSSLVQNTILDRLRATTLEGRLTEFYDEFKKLSTVEDGKQQERLAMLKAQYNAIIRDGEQEYKRLQELFGVDYTPAQSQGAISSSIGRSITEETATAIAGPIIGTYEEAKKIASWMGKSYAIATQNLEMAIKIEANTRRTADNTERLQGIESGISEIARNTRKSPGSTLTDSYNKLPNI